MSILSENPVWCEMTPKQAFAATTVAIAEAGGRPFTVCFPEDDAQKLTKSHDPVRSLRKRFERAFKSFDATGSAVVFRIEFSPAGDFHCHGSILPEREMEWVEIRDMLKLVSGKVAKNYSGKFSKYGAGRLVDVASFTDPEGWSKYTWKNVAKTRRLLGGKESGFMNHAARRLGKNLFSGVCLSASEQSPAYIEGNAASQKSASLVQAGAKTFNYSKLRLTQELSNRRMGGIPNGQF